MLWFLASDTLRIPLTFAASGEAAVGRANVGDGHPGISRLHCSLRRSPVHGRFVLMANGTNPTGWRQPGTVDWLWLKAGDTQACDVGDQLKLGWGARSPILTLHGQGHATVIDLSDEEDASSATCTAAAATTSSNAPASAVSQPSASDQRLYSAAASALPSSRAPSRPTHRFVWDAATCEHLERLSVPAPSRARGDPLLKAIAHTNYTLVQQGGYLDVAGVQHSLALPPTAANRTHSVPRSAAVPLAPPHTQTRIAIARTDTATALRVVSSLGARRAAALNFANQFQPGGGYTSGARAQEEDLCRLIPTLFGSLRRRQYPFKEWECHYSDGWLARTAGTYALDGPPLPVHILTAAMPNLGRQKRLIAGSGEWQRTCRVRIRAVLHAAKAEGCDALVLGAFGCGAFANPPELVAVMMAELVASEEFRGCFASIVLAILVNRAGEDANVSAFARAFGRAGLCAATPDHATPALSAVPCAAAAAAAAGAEVAPSARRPKKANRHGSDWESSDDDDAPSPTARRLV